MGIEGLQTRPLFFDINHPVQALMLRPVIEALRERGHRPRIFARDKDVTLGLLGRFGLPATTLTRRRHGRLGALVELISREARLLQKALAERPQAIIGTSVHAARVGKLSGAVSIVINDDDALAVPLFVRLAYPLADVIATPLCLQFEKHKRQVTYRGNQQLFYLHPARFRPEPAIRTELGIGPGQRYGVVRLSALDAHHDVGVRGLGRTHLGEIARMVPAGFQMFASLEKRQDLPDGWRALDLPPDRLHHVLAFADFFLGDGQTMTAEAAVLGTPALRLNDFVGRISYLKELESYGLAFGFRPGDEASLLKLLADLLGGTRPRSDFERARARFLSDMVDPLPWFTDLVSSHLRPHV
jgi:predicted glycosyltransferase